MSQFIIEIFTENNIRIMQVIYTGIIRNYDKLKHMDIDNLYTHIDTVIRLF